MDLGCMFSSLTILWEATVFVYYIIVLPCSTLKQQCKLFRGKMHCNVLALVSDRAERSPLPE